MKIKLITPFEKLDSNISSAETFKIQQLTFPLLAAITPPEHSVKIVDESFLSDETNEYVDLVGITVITDLALRAYQLADNYRKRGVKVVMGGIHASVLPYEALKHADAVVIGEGENVWPALLEDATRNRLKKVYAAKNISNLTGRPIPRHDLYPDPSKRGYTRLAVGIETSRGCPFNCEFCATSQIRGIQYRTRPIYEIIREIETINNPILLFVDDNLALDRKYAKQLFSEMIPFRKKWLGESTISLAEDQELLKVMKLSGCVGLLLGFESLSKDTQKTMTKFKNLRISHVEAINRFHNEGIPILGAFVFGFDNENKDIFDQTIEFAMSMKLDLGQFRPLTPYPGTRLYNRLSEEGRLTVPDWWLQRNPPNSLFFQPKKMTHEEFIEGMERVTRNFFSIWGIASRYFGINPLKRSLGSSLLYLGTNLANRYRYYSDIRR